MTDLNFIGTRIREFMSSGISVEISPRRAFTKVPQRNSKAMQMMDYTRMGWHYVLCHIGFYQSRTTHEREQTKSSRRPYQSMNSVLEHTYKKHAEVPRSERTSFFGTQIDVVNNLWVSFTEMYQGEDREKPSRMVKDMQQ
ncbi:hypothetical protein PG989_016606 [Apiospora arundinis]|uniref:Uncharacterized protein n=1 Tax=Apiospora arundinis TaxID=335852 RepID=A0ABR2JGJ3_9PEZI